MQIALVAAVVLVAVLVGVAIPVLIQLRATLRSAQQVLDRLAPRLEVALTEVTEAADRLNRMAGELEERAKKAKPLFDSLSGLGDQLSRLRNSLGTAASIGGALGPAVAAAVRAFLHRPDGRPAAPDAPSALESKNELASTSEKETQP